MLFYKLCKCCANRQNKNANNPTIGLLALHKVVLLGFEPRQADPETAVLPLHHKTVFIIEINFRVLASERVLRVKNTKKNYLDKHSVEKTVEIHS